MSSESTKALEYKTKGNGFFLKKDYANAHAQYTLAIELDDTNAIYYFSNRAACSMFLQKYENAREDAIKATELDTKYSKGWSRLASALVELELFADSIEAWKAALACLPESGLNKIEEGQKKTYKQGLWAAEGALRITTTDTATVMNEEEYRSRLEANEPWKRAAKVLGELKAARNFRSSAYAIEEAHTEFEQAVAIINATGIVTGPDGRQMVTGPGPAMQCFSNAVMQDERVFHTVNADLLPRMFKQVDLELRAFQGWEAFNLEKRILVANIISEAQALLAFSGWRAVRHALLATVRSLIIYGFLYQQALANPKQGFHFFDKAVDLIQLGRRTWPNVTKQERGTVFEDSFLRGTRRMRLSALHIACSCDLDSAKPEFKLEYLIESAQELLDETLSSTRPTEQDYASFPGHYLSFYDTPLAEAYSTLGWCHRKLGARVLHQEATVKSETDEAPSEKFSRILRKSGELYHQAAVNYPGDDERHPIYLKQAANAFLHAQEPLQTIVPLLEAFESAVPKAKRIWEFSASGQNNDVQRDTRIWLEWSQSVKKHLKDGAFTLEDVVVPGWKLIPL